MAFDARREWLVAMANIIGSEGDHNCRFIASKVLEKLPTLVASIAQRHQIKTEIPILKRRQIMEAKDTVMSDEELDIVNNDRRAQIACQAETSFKAGIREVVEWLRENLHNPETTQVTHRTLGKRTLDAKLKEWGIE